MERLIDHLKKLAPEGEIVIYGERKEADSEAELYRKIVGRDSAVIGKRKR